MFINSKIEAINNSEVVYMNRPNKASKSGRRLPEIHNF